MHRFFVPPDWIQGRSVALTGPQAQQIARVLRLRPGERVIVLDDLGSEFQVQLIAVRPDLVRGEVVTHQAAGGEPRARIALYQGMLKGDHFELVLQKGTEVGVVEFVPLLTARTIAARDTVSHKRSRWEAIIQEAAEQSRRGRKPALRPALSFALACEEAGRAEGLKLIAWEEEGQSSLRAVLRGAGPATPPCTRDDVGRGGAIHLFIGPEGGFTREEVLLARAHGLAPVSLGRRILRAETAGLVAAAAILYELGELE
jgi:16S rRNA (uracil1498-N3)-methyltransferase